VKILPAEDAIDIVYADLDVAKAPLADDAACVLYGLHFAWIHCSPGSDAGLHYMDRATLGATAVQRGQTEPFPGVVR
jgi:hypothetical protein